MDLDDPIEVALAAAEAFAAAKLQCALYGGLLTAVYGEPRETRDADFVVLTVDAVEARRLLAQRGIDAVVAFERIVFGGLVLGRVTLIGGLGDTGLNTIDLVQPRDDRYGLRVIERSVVSTLRHRDIRIVSAEDYIVLKVLSTRDRDIEDAAAVLRRNAEILEHDVIDSELQWLARALPDVSVVERWARVRALAGERPPSL